MWENSGTTALVALFSARSDADDKLSAAGCGGARGIVSTGRGMVRNAKPARSARQTLRGVSSTTTSADSQRV
jgi:hypothetical protein